MKVIGVTLEFVREDDVSLVGTPIVVYRVQSRHWNGEIRAATSGVSVSGTFPTMTTEECVAFEETLARARVQAGHLAQGGEPLTDAQVDLILGPIPFFS
jgi:hypothetical protein